MGYELTHFLFFPFVKSVLKVKYNLKKKKNFFFFFFLELEAVELIMKLITCHEITQE